jgi:hypothetical protein
MEGRNLSVMYIINPTLSGFIRLDRDCQSGFLVVNTVGDTSKPEASNPAADTSEKRLIELLRAGIGVADCPVKIDGVARWRSVSDVARSYQAGRVFIAGDAAHVMPPNGGFGGNTGIADAHNIAWKLAMVLRGTAGPALLDTYQQERGPVGKFTVEQAYTRYVTRSATYLGAKDFEPQVNDFNIELGYLYHSQAIASENDDAAIHADPQTTCGRPGSRAPHLWIEKDGKRVSTLDLFGGGFTLLAAPNGEVWSATARDAAKDLGIALEAYTLGQQLSDPEDRFASAYGLAADGAALVMDSSPGVVAMPAAIRARCSSVRWRGYCAGMRRKAFVQPAKASRVPLPGPAEAPDRHRERRSSLEEPRPHWKRPGRSLRSL